MINNIISKINSIIEGIFLKGNDVKSFEMLKNYVETHTNDPDNKCILTPNGRLDVRISFGCFMFDSIGYKEKITIKIMKNSDATPLSHYNNSEGFMNDDNVIIYNKFDNDIKKTFDFIKPLFSIATPSEIKRFFDFNKVFNDNYFVYNDNIIKFNKELLTNKQYTFLSVKDIYDMYNEWEKIKKLF